MTDTPDLAAPDLAALVGSRLCHDLISPIGAIGNGVELMTLDGVHDGPELALIAQSVAHATARIRLFRLAFGMAARDQRVARTEVLAILSDLSLSGRIKVDWTTPSDLDRRTARRAVLMILCLEHALPQGGVIRLDTGEHSVDLAVASERLRINAALWDRLLRPGDAHAPASPADVQFAVLADDLARHAVGITVSLTPADAPTQIRLRLAPSG